MAADGIRYCSKCQANLSKNSKFCAKCGMKYVAPIPKKVESVQLNPPNISSKSNTDANIKLAAGIIVGLLFGFIFASAFTSETTNGDGVSIGGSISELEDLVNTLELELNSVNKLNNEYKTDNELLEQQIKEYGDLQTIISNINLELEEIKNEKIILESEIGENLDKISELEELNAELENKVPSSNNQRELDELISKIELLEKNQESLENIKASLDNEVSGLTTQIRTLNAKIASIEDDNVDLENLNAELQKKLDESTANSLANHNEIRDLANNLKTKVVLVNRCYYLEDQNGNPYASQSVVSGNYHYVEGKYYWCIGSGTGYFISTNGCILTNAHVAPSDGYIEFADGSVYERIFVVELYDGEMQRAYHLKAEGSNNNDLSLLRINSFTSSPVKFATSHPQKDSQVVTVGHPSYLGWWVKSAGIYVERNPDSDYIFQIPAYYGSSGSPILNMDNELIGMIKSMILLADPIMPYSNLIISKHNFGIERMKRTQIFADNIFDIKSFVSGTICSVNR